MGRDIKSCIIIDNSPYSYLFQPDHAVPISSWFDDKSDRELYDLVAALEEINKFDDVTVGIRKYKRQELIP